MYDTSSFSPPDKGETKALFANEIDPKALESLFDLDPSLEDSFDLTEYVAGGATSFTDSLLTASTQGVPDSAVVATPVADSLVTLTSAAAGQHLADIERRSPSTANVNFLLQQTSPGPVVTSAVSPNHQQSALAPVLSPSLTVDEVSQALSDDSCVFMPEFETLAASTAAATSTNQNGQWEQAPFYSTVKTEDLTLCSLTACSMEANLPGFTSTTTTSTVSPVCKMEYVDEGSSPDISYTRASHGRTLSESSSTTTSSVNDTPRRSSKGGSRRRQVPKGSEEYKEKRARNNVAVRKSRAKAKEKQRMTEVRVKELVDRNDTLQKKVEMLTKELTVLKGLFVNVGASLPDDFAKIMEQS